MKWQAKRQAPRGWTRKQVTSDEWGRSRAGCVLCNNTAASRRADVDVFCNDLGRKWEGGEDRLATEQFVSSHLEFNNPLVYLVEIIKYLEL